MAKLQGRVLADTPIPEIYFDEFPTLRVSLIGIKLGEQDGHCICESPQISNTYG